MIGSCYSPCLTVFLVILQKKNRKFNFTNHLTVIMSFAINMNSLKKINWVENLLLFLVIKCLIHMLTAFALWKGCQRHTASQYRVNRWKNTFRQLGENWASSHHWRGARVFCAPVSWVKFNFNSSISPGIECKLVNRVSLRFCSSSFFIYIMRYLDTILRIKTHWYMVGFKLESSWLLNTPVTTQQPTY